MTTRREWLIAMGALSAGWASAQPVRRAGRTTRIALFIQGTRPTVLEGHEKTFVDAMREMGWVEGRNVVYDRAYAERNTARGQSAAAELVSRAPDVIWVAPGAAANTFVGTRAIPVVFSNEEGVVERGLVKTLASPGGNMTGVQSIGRELGGKRLQLLKQALPKITRVGVLDFARRDGSSSQEFATIENAAATLGVTLVQALPKAAAEFDAAIASLSNSRTDALLVIQTAVFHGGRKRIIELAASRRLPVVGPRSEYANDGALMAYGALLSDQVHRSAQIVDKILKGAKPADIPVELPTKFELVVNLRVAKNLGIAIPGEVLLQATRVIE